MVCLSGEGGELGHAEALDALFLDVPIVDFFVHRVLPIQTHASGENTCVVLGIIYMFRLSLLSPVGVRRSRARRC